MNKFRGKIVMEKEENKMTLLRRTAQLIEDLRTIGVISKKDKVSTREGDYKSTEANAITLTITYDREDYFENYMFDNLIERFILEEFAEEEYQTKIYTEVNKISVVLFKKPQ